MRRRVIGVIAAIALAVVGTGVLVAYVQGAEDRALAGEELVAVWVVTDPIPAGTPAEGISDSIETESVPSKVRVEDAVTSLEDLEGLVASVELLPGEQLTASRFVARQQLRTTTGALAVPEGMLEVTVSLEPERAVGGNLVPGDTVAVFSSFEPFDYSAPETEDGSGAVLLVDGVPVQGDGRTPNSTHLILHKLLVTRVQIEELPDDEDEDEDGNMSLAPTGNLLVTLALDASSAERLVFTAEHGRVWLAAEPADAPEDDTSIQTRATVYDALGRVVLP